MSRELVIKLAVPVSGITVSPTQVAPSQAGPHTPFTDFHRFLVAENLLVAPMRRQSAARPSAPGITPSTPDMKPHAVDQYLYVHEDEDGRLEELRTRFLKIPLVIGAFLKPEAEVIRQATVPGPSPTGAASPDFSPRQSYLDPAPGGIDIVSARTRIGGGGDGVTIIDVEGDWNFDHEKLAGRFDQSLVVLPDPKTIWPGNRVGWTNHGTAVMAILSSLNDGVGIAGMAPMAKFGVVSIFASALNKTESATAILTAANLLSSGDILLIELHRPGPRYGYTVRADQRGYIPVEWWDDDFDAIQFATSRGIIVVEAGGNGDEDLDATIYNTPAPGTAPTWNNPFPRSANRDSGAVLVGAGVSPRTGTLDRSRLNFSNYGSAIDAQGWGEAVVTAGYGDLQNGPDPNVWYTAQFAGTSSALPIVAGVVACLQGIRRAGSNNLITPQAARLLLRGPGSPQQWLAQAPQTDRIGSRPDLTQLS